MIGENNFDADDDLKDPDGVASKKTQKMPHPEKMPNEIIKWKL